MIGVDTNVLVRYLVEDDARQSERAAKLIDQALERDERIFVSQIVLCEMVWVLGSGYGFPRAEVAALLRALLRARQVAVDEIDTVRTALENYSIGKADFADYLILERARAAGCEGLASFDQTLAAEPGVFSP